MEAVGDSSGMGVKRWILALSIPVVVLGLLVALFFQMGADERVINGILPKSAA